LGASLSPSWPSQQPPKPERLSPRHHPQSAVGKDKGKDTSILFPPLGSETPHTPIGTRPQWPALRLALGLGWADGPHEGRDVKVEKSEKAAPVLVKEAVQEREAVVVGKAKEKKEQKAEPPVKKEELTQQKEEAPKKTETETETPAVVEQQQHSRCKSSRSSRSSRSSSSRRCRERQ